MEKDNMPESPIDLQALDEILDEFKGIKGAEIPILQRAQNVYGYLPKEVLAAISEKTGTPLSQLMGVATFYSQFHLARRGRNLIRVCDGTACHVRGATKIVEGLQDSLHIDPGQSDPDYKYALEIVYCIGSCGLAPAVVVNDKVHGHVETKKLLKELKKLT
jgi:NADH:ubiquinone oxidoreductase subunit E